jgi:acetate kinase
MKELIKNKGTDAHAAEAFELFCYQTKKFIGGYAAALEGLDTLVFSGGIGEHSPEVRSQVCDGLEFLGIELDEIKNMNNEAVISATTSKVSVRVIKTNEQLMIARQMCNVLGEII